MIPPWCLALAVLICAATTGAAQGPPPPAAPEGVASPLAGDERTARLAERYKVMLAANPAEGIALDRLWGSYEDRGATAALIEEYRDRATGNGGAPAWLVYGHLLKKAGRFDDAASAYDAAGKADPASVLPRLARAELALVRHHPEEAAPLFADALAKIPPNDRRRADLLLKTGNAWLAAGQPAKATEAWEQLVAANPANLALRKQLAETYARNGLADKALAHWEYIDAHADPAARAAALREAGRLHESRGEFDAARDAYERGLALTSRDNWLYGELLTAIIRLYERAGRTAELETRWRRAVEQTPRDLGGYLRLETLAETQGDTKGEEEWLNRITTLAPRDRDSRLKLARLLAAGGQRERAAAVYDGLLKEQPDQLDLLFARADLDLQAGASAEAVSRIEGRLAKNPADEATAAAGLEFFLSRHLDDAAEKCLRAALGRQPAALEPAMALAKFLFARRRADEGRQVLDHAANEPGGSATAERWGRIAQVYKDELLPAEALRCWREVAKLTPRDPAPQEAIGELLLARGDTPAAVEALQTAVANRPEGTAREEAEHRLFQVLSASSENSGSASGRTGRRPGYFESLGPSGMTLVAPGSDVLPKDAPLDRYLAGLEGAVRTQPTAESFMRLARWQLWAGRFNQALASAERAVACDPTVAARQLFVRVATDAHRHDLAGRALLELEERDPAHEVTYARQLAGLEMDDGEFDAAITGYGRVQAEQPGAVEPLTDLALAQQRADRWFDALATWKTAYALTALTPARRAEVRRSLLAVYEHVGEFQPAAELLAQAVDSEAELSRRQELFQELSEFCSKHALGAWLDAQYEARLQAQPDDYFTMAAVAARRKNQGRDEEAYRLLRRAYYSAPDPIAALKSLADEAEALGEDDQAVADRRRLVNMPGQDTAENLSKLAVLQENNLDEGAAARTWEQIVARFPRDTNSLALAADFFERISQPERARALLVRVDSIEPGDLPHLFHLAELARDAGDQAGARETFEKVLARSEAEKPGDPLRLPAELEGTAESPLSRHGSTFFLTAPPAASPPGPAGPGSDDHILRLAAIRELARLLPAADVLPGREARSRWLERWKAAVAGGGRSEPLQAFFYAGDAAGTMDLLAGWMSEQPADRSLRQAFLRAGMQLGDYGRLARWAWLGEADQRGVRGSQLVEALQRFLAEGGKPGANIAGELFPPSVRAGDLLWKAAKEGFAERRWYAQAAELGERVVTLAAIDRSASALDVAQWELLLDRPERARAVLRQTLNDVGGIALDGSGGSAVYEALRAYYLLLAPGERAPFVEAYLRECAARGEPVRRVLPAVLLHGLQGDETSARQDLDALLALRPAVPESDERSLDARHWSYLLDAGAQLENWNLGSLAAYLWRKALQEETAFDRANASAAAVLAEMRSRLVVLQAITAPDPESSRECVAAYLSENPRTELLRSVAAQLLAASQWPAARRCDEFLIRQEPANAENWRNLLGACEASGDLDATEQMLVALLGTPRSVPFSINPAELVRELAAVHQSEGDTAGAVRLLEREFHDGTRSLPVVFSLASAYEGMGRLDEAARVWQEGITADLGNARSYFLEQARLEERRGNPRGAISLLKGELAGRLLPGTGSAATELVGLYLQTGQIDQAKELASAGLKTNAFDDPGGVAEAFVRAGQPALLRDLLRTAILRSHDPQTRFQLQQSLLQHALPPNAPPAEFAREMRRLKHFAQGIPTLKSADVAVRYALARQHGADAWLEDELLREWQDGRGDFAAGEQLAGFYLDTHQTGPLQRVVQAIDARPNLPELSLANLEKRLTDAGLAALALPVSERLLRRFPQNEQYALARARVLWKSGRLDEAHRLLAALDRSSIFREDFAARIAALYEELGDMEQARAYDERAVQRDPTGARSAAACLRLAQMETQRKDWTAAASLLQKAYRQPVIASDLTPLVDFLQASGQLDGEPSRGLPGNGFPLTFPQRAQLLSSVYARLKSAGKLPAARAMVAAHPGFLAASPSLAAAWRQDATPGQIPAAIAALEDAAQSAAGPTPRLNRDLAALYLRWADDAVNADDHDPAKRLERLVRARQLAPDDFEVARRLAALCWEQNQPEQAAAALQPFLARDAVPEERRQAQELLAKH